MTRPHDDETTARSVEGAAPQVEPRTELSKEQLAALGMTTPLETVERLRSIRANTDAWPHLLASQQWAIIDAIDSLQKIDDALLALRPQRDEKDLVGDDAHGGRDDLGPAASPELPHDGSCELSGWDGRTNDPRPVCTCRQIQQADYDKPLDVTIENDALVIRIGIGVLAHVVTYSDWANPFKPDEGEYIRNFAITDAPQFAKDVASAMQDEREDGSSPLSDFIDAASEEAINQGSLGLDENFDHKIKHGEKSPLETW